MTSPKFEADFLVNGVSLLSIGCIVDFNGVFEGPPLRGENVMIPGVPGEMYVPKVRGAYDFTVQMTFATEPGSTQPVHALTLAKVKQLRTLLDSSSAPLTFTRKYPLFDGTIVSESCLGTYASGLEFEFVGFRHGRAALVLRNISGTWT